MIVCPRCHGTGKVAEKAPKMDKGRRLFQSRGHLSVRAYNCLRNNLRSPWDGNKSEITKEEVKRYINDVGERGLLRVPNLGRSTLGEIMAWIESDIEDPRPRFAAWEEAKQINDRHNAGETYQQIADSMSISKGRAARLVSSYRWWLQCNTDK